MARAYDGIKRKKINMYLDVRVWDELKDYAKRTKQSAPKIVEGTTRSFLMYLKMEEMVKKVQHDLDDVPTGEQLSEIVKN